MESFGEHVAVNFGDFDTFYSRTQNVYQSAYPGSSHMQGAETTFPCNLEIFKKAHCLIDTSKGDFQVNEQVLNQIRCLDKPLVVVSMVGPYRSGKSYLLNLMGGGSYLKGGFQTGGTVQALTKGIWVWVRKHPTSNDRYIILLDTEGIGDAQSSDHDYINKVFCLATLLSSLLVFNDMNAIDNQSLDHISFISGMSHHLSTQGMLAEYDEYFPWFVYAIRDFFLALNIDGEDIEPDDYLENALRIKPAKNERGKQYNTIRRYIRNFFKRRKCFVFDRPVYNPKELQKIDEMENVQLNESFESQFQDFYKFAIERGPVKRLICGGNYDGEMWANLVKECVRNIESGIPSVENTVNTVSRNQNLRVAKKGVEIYKQMMCDTLTFPTSYETISAAHSNALKAAVTHYVKKSVFVTDNSFQIKMNDDIKRLLTQFEMENTAASKRACSQYLEELYNKEIGKKIHSGGYIKDGGIAEYTEDFHRLQAEYRKNNKLGCEKQAVWAEFQVKLRREEESIINADKSIRQQERERMTRLIEEKDKERNNAIKQHEKELKKFYKEKEDEANRLNMEIMRLKREHQIATIQQKCDDIIQQKDSEAQRLRNEGLPKEAEVIESEKPKYEAKKDEAKSSWCKIL